MLIRIPKIGGVVIKNNGEIDTLTIINSGTIEATITENNVMTDNYIHILRNVHIEKIA